MSYTIHTVRDLSGSISSQVFEHKFYDINEAASYWKNTMSKNPDIIDAQLKGVLDNVSIYDDNDKVVKYLDRNLIPQDYEDISNVVTREFYIIAVKEVTGSGRMYLVSSISWTPIYHLANKFNSPEEAVNYFNNVKSHIRNINESMKVPLEYVVIKVTIPVLSESPTEVKTLYKRKISDDISMNYYISAEFEVENSSENSVYYLDRDSDDNLFFTPIKPGYHFKTYERAELSYYDRCDEINNAARRMFAKPDKNNKMIIGVSSFSVMLGVTYTNTATPFTNYYHMFEIEKRFHRG